MPSIVDTDRVRELCASGAQLVDVLPPETYAQEHLPGAVNLPLAHVGRATEVLDPSKPVVVYCYDHECDLSPRAAARLEALGFREVHDYVAGKVAWLAAGLPGEGLVGDRDRARSRLHPDVPSVGPDATLADAAAVVGEWEVVVVLDVDRVVLGVVRREALGGGGDVPVASVLQSAPPTVRPSIPLSELARTMDDDGQRHLLVTTFSGTLLGLIRRDELDDADVSQAP